MKSYRVYLSGYNNNNSSLSNKSRAAELICNEPLRNNLWNLCEWKELLMKFGWIGEKSLQKFTIFMKFCLRIRFFFLRKFFVIIVENLCFFALIWLTYLWALTVIWQLHALMRVCTYLCTYVWPYKHTYTYDIAYCWTLCNFFFFSLGSKSYTHTKNRPTIKLGAVNKFSKVFFLFSFYKIYKIRKAN